VRLHQDAGGEAEQGVVVGKDPDDVGAALEFEVESFERVGRPDLAPLGDGEAGEGGEVGAGVAQQPGDVGQAVLEAARDRLDLSPDSGRVGLSEDRADRCGDPLGLSLRGFGPGRCA
jgi:hypothetical protein